MLPAGRGQKTENQGLLGLNLSSSSSFLALNAANKREECDRKQKQLQSKYEKYGNIPAPLQVERLQRHRLQCIGPRTRHSRPLAWQQERRPRIASWRHPLGNPRLGRADPAPETWTAGARQGERAPGPAPTPPRVREINGQQLGDGRQHSLVELRPGQPHLGQARLSHGIPRLLDGLRPGQRHPEQARLSHGIPRLLDGLRPGQRHPEQASLQSFGFSSTFAHGLMNTRRALSLDT